MSSRAASPPTLIRTTMAESLGWMRTDLMIRLIPFGLVVLGVWTVARPAWLGLSAGRLQVQLAVGAAGCLLMFLAATALQLVLTRRTGRSLKVPAASDDALLQGAYYAANATIEEAFFRGLLQGGLTALAGPALGIVVATPTYVLYHRLGGWRWADVLPVAMVGVPLALAFWLLPGPPSLVGVIMVHFGATCGFLGPGPWLLRRLHLV
jgi:membrane protease YdiL (CAAX protease family)